VAVIEHTVATTAAENAAKPTREIATSSTHRKEYMAFLRAANHPYLGFLWDNVFTSNRVIFKHKMSYMFVIK